MHTYHAPRLDGVAMMAFHQPFSGALTPLGPFSSRDISVLHLIRQEVRLILKGVHEFYCADEKKLLLGGEDPLPSQDSTHHHPLGRLTSVSMRGLLPFRPMHSKHNVQMRRRWMTMMATKKQQHQCRWMRFEPQSLTRSTRSGDSWAI
jgi:hypothetical protein